jgi:hypothetical protein
LHQLNSEYGDTFFMVTGEEAITIEKDVGLVRAVTSRDQDVR